ncbi:MAG: histidine--tRNA ligase [Bacteroidia bacterium]
MKPSLVKGTRDFGPAVMQRRKHLFNTIETVFKKYGFMPLETPAMEQLETLTGKYGDEGDKLLFKILNSGDFAANINDENLQSKASNKIASQISEKGLRYDLTVPLARYVAMNRNEIAFPFKRYQMQPVWRADRPQRGRYREFWQCDADIIGSDSLMNEADLLCIMAEVFEKLGIKISILLNNRKILEAIAFKLNLEDKFQSLVVLIDKLDKVGFEGIFSELEELGLDNFQIDKLKNLLGDKMPFNINSIATIENNLTRIEKANVGCDEFRKILDFVGPINILNSISIDLSLARGLDYYTGCIIEIKANDVKMGSISGGGRYDNLTGVFGLPGVSGVGISFGIDRIYDVMEELNLFANLAQTEVKAMFCHLDENGRNYNYSLANELRKVGFSIEVFPDIKKLPKQFEYAEKKGIPIVIITGDDEINSGQLSYKNLVTKEQGKIGRDELGGFLAN